MISSAGRLSQYPPDGPRWLRCHNPVTHYRFLLSGDEGAGVPAYRWLNGTGLHLRDVPDADDFRVVTYPAPPRWTPGAVAYQVFPDRFARDSVVEPAGQTGAPRTDLPDMVVTSDGKATGASGPRVSGSPAALAAWLSGQSDGSGLQVEGGPLPAVPAWA